MSTDYEFFNSQSICVGILCLSSILMVFPEKILVYRDFLLTYTPFAQNAMYIHHWIWIHF